MMWTAWFGLALFLMGLSAARDDREGASLLGLIVVGLLAVQLPPMALESAAARLAQAAIWGAAARLALWVVNKSPNGGKSFVPVYLALIVPCMGVGWFLQRVGFPHGPTNPGVIASHVLGTLAILEAGGAGIAGRVGRMGRALRRRRGRGSVGVASPKVAQKEIGS